VSAVLTARAHAVRMHPAKNERKYVFG